MKLSCEKCLKAEVRKRQPGSWSYFCHKDLPDGEHIRLPSLEWCAQGMWRVRILSQEEDPSLIGTEWNETWESLHISTEYQGEDYEVIDPPRS